MPPDTLPHSIDRMATAVGVFVLLAVVWKELTSLVPFQVPLRFVAGVGVAVVTIVGLQALGERSPVALVLCVALVGLISFFGWRWVRTAKARETRAGQIEHARGRERRRAQPP